MCFYNIGVKGDMLNNYGNTFVSQTIKLGEVVGCFAFSSTLCFCNDSTSRLLPKRTLVHVAWGTQEIN